MGSAGMRCVHTSRSIFTFMSPQKRGSQIRGHDHDRHGASGSSGSSPNRREIGFSRKRTVAWPSSMERLQFGKLNLTLAKRARMPCRNIDENAIKCNKNVSLSAQQSCLDVAMPSVVSRCPLRSSIAGSRTLWIIVDGKCNTESSEMDQVMRMKDVVKKIGLCRATIYAMISRGEFPRPIRIGERATGWRESELEAWLANRTAARERSASALPSGR
ncbi:helix-turn-helix transcriptional regulator [Paraburkholderia phenoliruptrix]